MAISLVFDSSSPRALDLTLAPFTGPLTAIEDFDPRKDLSLFVDGVQVRIQDFLFVSGSNLYRMFLSDPLSLGSLVQVIHHAPSQPFADVNDHKIGGVACFLILD